jgi:hypothetical protein
MDIFFFFFEGVTKRDEGMVAQGFDATFFVSPQGAGKIGLGCRSFWDQIYADSLPSKAGRCRCELVCPRSS